MPLTLREALTIAEPLRRSRVIAGERGLDNVVQSVNVMEVPDILEWVHPGELLVTTMYPLRDDVAAIQTLIPRLAEKGLAGLAVNPLTYLNQFPQCMIDAANALGFPLIELPDKVSFVDIIQPLTSRILALQADELVQSAKIHRQFLDLVLGGGGFADIAQGMAQLVKRPISIVDRFRRVLGNAFVIGQAQAHKRFINEAEGRDSYLSDEYAPELLAQLPGSEAKLMAVAGPEGRIEHVVCPVKVGSLALGEIIAWGPFTHPQQSIDLIAIEQGATVVALKMMEERSIRGVEQRFRNEILEGLLSDQPSAHERAIYLSRELGYRLAPPFALILVGSDLPSATLLTKAERIDKSNIDTSLYLATRYIRAIRSETVFWYEGPRLVIFFPLQAAEVARAKPFLVQELSRICQRIAAENDPYTVSMGVSSHASEVVQFRQAYTCAKQALQAGQWLQEHARGVVTHYEDLGIFRIVSLAESPASIERFCEDTIGPLLAYDRQHGTELVKTLRVFLEQHCNAAKAARALYLHYNTLRYRLDRIEEILGNVFDHPQQRLSLEVALQIHALISSS